MTQPKMGNKIGLAIQITTVAQVDSFIGFLLKTMKKLDTFGTLTITSGQFDGFDALKTTPFLSNITQDLLGLTCQYISDKRFHCGIP
jgi:hypothetical protein